MSESSGQPQKDLKRYKSYPPEHFSRRRMFWYFFILRLIVTPFLVLKYRIEVVGKRNVPKQGPFIVASNHISMLDPPLLSYATQAPIAYMAKRELFEKKVWAAEFYRFVGTFALDRENPDSATLKTAFNVLKSPAKWVLGLFPEGTRSMTGEILPLKKGIGSLAQKTKAPVLPVCISKLAKNRYRVSIGKLITDVSDGEAVQQQVAEALAQLSAPSVSGKE